MEAEYDTKIKIHINDVKGDKNNVAFTHGYKENSQVTGDDSGATGDISDRYFSIRDVKTEDDVLTISETENSVKVSFQNTDNGITSAAFRELPTKEYVDNVKQDTLVSGTNIKTINGASVLGEGDLEIKVSESLETDFTPFDSTPESIITQSGDFYGQFKFYKNNGFSSGKYGIEFKETDIGYDIKTSLPSVKDSYSGNIVGVGEYSTHLVSKEYVDEVKGDKNNIAFTHGFTDSNPENLNTVSDCYFSFGDVETENDILTISETEKSVTVTFQNFENNPSHGPATYTTTRELPTKKYVDDAISGAAINGGGASFSVNTLSNPGGSEIKSTITQGDSSTGLSYQKNMNGDLPNYIYASVNDDSFSIPTTGYVEDKIIAANTVGTMEGSTGVYIPTTISPSAIGNGSLLVTEANGTTLGSKSLSVTTGANCNITKVLSANVPTTTTFTFMPTNWENKLKTIIISNLGVATRSEATADRTVKITSVKQGTTDITTSTKPSNISGTSVTITTDGPLPETGDVSQIRVYPQQNGFSNVLCGQGISGNNAGASVIVGQMCHSQGNANLVVGASMVNLGNGSALLGRQHYNNKNRAFLAGTGHDTSNGPSEAVAAVGQWSDIKSTTLFAVGNGTSDTTRQNAFEVTNDGKIVLRSPDGSRWAIAVDDSGNVTTTKL